MCQIPMTLEHKPPRQQRSKDRVEAILDAALGLVVEQGAEALAMREVARRAGVQIGSIYQYFPSKSAVIRELARRNLERVHELLAREVEALFAGGRPPAPSTAVNRVVDAYFAHYRDHPEAMAVWGGAQSDPELQQLEVEDTRSTARFMVPPLAKILRRDDEAVLHALALLMNEVTGAAVRLALSVEPPLREQLVKNLKAMLVATLRAQRR
jgi:AcrR family transcriptional regulator